MNSLKVVVVERAAVVEVEEASFPSESIELAVAPPFGVSLPREC